MKRGFKLNHRRNHKKDSKNYDLNLNYRNHVDDYSDDHTNSNSTISGAPSSSSSSSSLPSSPVVMKKSNETLEEAYQRIRREQYAIHKDKQCREKQIQMQQQQQQQQQGGDIHSGGGGRWSLGMKKGKHKKSKKNNETTGSKNVYDNLDTDTTSSSFYHDRKTSYDDQNNILSSSSTPNNNNQTAITTSSAIGNNNNITSKAISSNNNIVQQQQQTNHDNNVDNPELIQLQQGQEKPQPTSDTTTTVIHSTSLPSSSSTTTLSKATTTTLNPTPTPTRTGPRRAMSKESIAKDESKIRKILIRFITGLLMVGVFVSTMYCGHIYICSLIFFTEVMLFKELLTVRYHTFFHIIEETIPLFRTTQWMWFVTAIFYTYSDFVVEVIRGNTSLHYLLEYARFQTGFAFLLYSTTFVVSIATMHKDHIRFQINQLCWTILVLCLTVGQLKYVMHNVYNGLIWFTLPIMLVVSNDSFAWLAGVTCGKKFIQKPLSALSPNKTWEGFLGGWIGTMIFGWYLSSFLTQFTWMTCPTNNFSLIPEKLECDLDPVFLKAKHIFPSQIFEIFPSPLMSMLPGVVDICMIDGNVDELTACVSGEDSHTHHHFELVLKDFYPIQLHTLGLSLFASFVAPFGGFLASAIKRAYGLKDFGSLFPGHGGMMDRMDCQFLMALCTWVHYNTFVKMATVSVPKMIYMFHNLNDAEKREFLEKIVGETVQNVDGQCQVSFD